MLTTSEVNQLFDLLKELHGKDKPRDERTISIWATVLKPWNYKQVRGAVLERARSGNRYYPDPTEIAELLPASAAQTYRTMGPVGPMDARAKEEQDRLFSRWKKEQDRLAPLRRAAGLPGTAMEAQTAGMPYTEWQAALEAAGLSTPDSVWGKEAVADGTA